MISLEEARRKLRICLVIVVMVAIIVGCVYYFGEVKNGSHVNEGTLVRRTVAEDVYGC